MKTRRTILFVTLCSVFLGIQQSGSARAEEMAVAENPSNSHEPAHEFPIEILKGAEAPPSSSMEWRILDISVVRQKFGTSLSSFLRVRGMVSPKNRVRSRIFCEDVHVPVRPDGNFEFEIPYDGSVTHLDLSWISASGEILEHEVEFRLKPEPELQMGTPEPSPSPGSMRETIPVVEFNRALDRRSFFLLGTGVSLIEVRQSESRISLFRNTVLSVKGAFNYFLSPPVWDFGVSGFMNVLGLGCGCATDVRILGVNARIGYVFPGIRNPWRLALYGGWYYSTMIASDQSFGYRNLNGPQIFPTLRRAFGNGSALSAYLKLSPISNRLSLMNLSNSEQAVGVSYLFPKWGKTFAISLDFSRLRFGLEGVEIRTSSSSLGLSMAF